MSPDDTSKHQSPSEADDWAADWLLASWVKIIDDISVDYPDFGLGVTLNVGGAIYSAVLVSSQKWASEMASMIRTKTVHQGIGEALAKSFEQVQQRYKDPAFRNAPIRFLHLLHASVVDAKGERSSEGLPMRFRLDAVAGWAIAGWAIGSMNVTPPPEFGILQ
jgi:hypothetical protein